MFCGKCGAKLPDGSGFCNVCGAPVGKAKKKNPIGLILIITGVIVVLLSTFITLEATGVTEVTGWFENEPSDRKETGKKKNGDIECEFPAPDYESVDPEPESWDEDYGYEDAYDEYYDDDYYDEYYDEYYDDEVWDEYGEYYDEYGLGDVSDVLGAVDLHGMADFFGAFGNGYTYDDYFTPPAPVQEEEHTQSYYDGYGDGYY